MPNFMVGGDGRTYEGCGWTYKSDYTINNETLTVGLLGKLLTYVVYLLQKISFNKDVAN